MIRKQTKRVLLAGMIIFYVTSLFALSLTTTLGATSGNSTCLDTIAGYGSSCKASIFPANNEITFQITKPDGSIVRFPCVANIEGIATCDLNSFHTRQAGVYHVGAYLSGNGTPTNMPTSVFKVYADTVSAVSSQFYASKQSVEANKTDSAYLMIILKDKYSNPIQGHSMEVISSRPDDTITKVNTTITNEEGKTYFKVTSPTAGVSTFIAKDLNTGVVLTERPKIVFYQSSPHYTIQTPSANHYSADILGNTAMGGGIAQSLQLIAPDTVKVNTPFDVSVQALDSNGEPALSYRGLVFFSSSDSTAKLPLTNTGYQFTGMDTNATHTFAKAVIFLNKGQYKLTVTDVDNPELEDSKMITVVDSTENNDNTNGPVIAGITLTAPTPNTKYGDSSVDITGKMKANTAYKVLDSGIEIGNDKSDSDGNIYFTAKGLSDGKHTIKVVSYDASGTEQDQSDEIIFYVDTTGATLTDLSFNPNSNLSPGIPITIKVVSQPKLSKVRVIVDKIAHDLTEDPSLPGTYTGTFKTPSKPGEYPITIVLTNALGKESTPNTNKKLVITSTGSAWKVTGLKTATGKTPGSVDLTWDNPPPSTTISGYTIYYDTNPLTLGNKLDASISTSAFTVSNLQPGSTYYFSVAAKNADGTEGPQSDIIPATAAGNTTTGLKNIHVVSEDSKLTFTWDDPKNPSIVKYQFDYGIKSGEYLEKAITKDSTPKWYIPDLINGVTYYVKLSALDQSNKVIYSSDEIVAIPGGDQYHPSACVAADVQNVQIVKRGNQRVMVWTAVPGATMYRIYSGTQQGLFNLPTRETKENYFVIPYLSTNVPYYYFAVKAVCGDNAQESINFSNILPVPTGTESIMIALISLIVVLMVRYVLRKKTTA
jgi:hypothetical protein